MFIILENIINTGIINKLKNAAINPENGAAVIFEGMVRNHNEGKGVTSLEYQAYASMAEKVGTKIVEEAKKNFNITHAVCIHATGHLQVGDIAVWAMATSHHRKESFLACEYIIDQVKKLVPIWKREHYLAGSPDWVACHCCSEGEHD